MPSSLQATSTYPEVVAVAEGRAAGSAAWAGTPLPADTSRLTTMRAFQQQRFVITRLRERGFRDVVAERGGGTSLTRTNEHVEGGCRGIAHGIGDRGHRSL